MSKKGLFRTHVALVKGSDVVWTKGSLQPYKQGVSVELTEAGYRYNDWRILYLGDFPNFPFNGGITQNIYFVVDGEWYLVQSKQNWSTQAKGVKHYKLIGQKTEKSSSIATPLPIGKLAQNFENAVNELDQATKLL